MVIFPLYVPLKPFHKPACFLQRVKDAQNHGFHAMNEVGSYNPTALLCTRQLLLRHTLWRHCCMDTATDLSNGNILDRTNPYHLRAIFVPQKPSFAHTASPPSVV